MIHRLDAGQPESWALFPLVMERCTQFIEEMELETPAADLTQYVRVHWAAHSPLVAVWVALAPSSLVIVGHLLATMEQHWGKPYGMIVQAKIDHPWRLQGSQRITISDELKAWALGQGATCLKMLTPRQPHGWHRLGGFTLDKYLLKRML